MIPLALITIGPFTNSKPRILKKSLFKIRDQNGVTLLAKYEIFIEKFDYFTEPYCTNAPLVEHLFNFSYSDPICFTSNVKRCVNLHFIYNTSICS